LEPAAAVGGVAEAKVRAQVGLTQAAAFVASGSVLIKAPGYLLYLLQMVRFARLVRDALDFPCHCLNKPIAAVNLR